MANEENIDGIILGKRANRGYNPKYDDNKENAIGADVVKSKKAEENLQV